MKYTELKNRIEKWAEEKGILEKGTPLAQIGKTEEEVAETREALVAQNNNLQTYVNSKGEIKGTAAEIEDGIGDQLVTIIIQCKMQNLDPLKCLEGAVNIIEKRTGKMINGQFVKD